MTIKPAIVQRIKQLCQEQQIKPNELATRSGITPSTIYSLLDETRKDVSVVTVKKICDGFEISLGEFFGHEIFSKLEQEIK